MASIPLPALAIQPQQTSPIESIGRLVALKNALAQQQLIPGELQAQQQNLQSGQLDIQNKQAIYGSQQAQMKALQSGFGPDAETGEVQPAESEPGSTSQPAAGGVKATSATSASAPPTGPSADSVLSSASPTSTPSDFTNRMWKVYGRMVHSGQVLPNDLFSFAGGIIKQQKDFADMAKTQQDVALNQLKNTKDLASQILAEKGPSKQAQLWQDTQEHFRNDPDAATKLYSPSVIQHVLNTPYPGEDATGRYFTVIQGSEAALADEKARLENLGSQQKFGPLPLATVAQTQREIDARAHELSPNTPLSPDFRLPPNATQADVDRIDTQLKALEGASPQIAGRKAAEAAARFPYEVGVAKVREQINNQFWNNKDAITKVETQVLQPYQQKLETVGELNSAIDQANAGNIAAARGVLLKLIGVTNPDGTKRYNSAEADRLSKMGNIPERFQGWASNLLTGNQWTPKMASDMEDFGKAQAQVALDSANSGIDNINHLHGSTVGHLSLPTNLATKGAMANQPTAAGGASVTTNDGVQHTFPTQKQADDFTKAAKAANLL